MLRRPTAACVNLGCGVGMAAAAPTLTAGMGQSTKLLLASDCRRKNIHQGSIKLHCLITCILKVDKIFRKLTLLLASMALSILAWISRRFASLAAMSARYRSASASFPAISSLSTVRRSAASAASSGFFRASIHAAAQHCDVTAANGVKMCH